jgi:hypothetical protein
MPNKSPAVVAKASCDVSDIHRIESDRRSKRKTGPGRGSRTLMVSCVDRMVIESCLETILMFVGCTVFSEAIVGDS